MITEEIIEAFIQKGYKCYKKAYKNTMLDNRLSRHQVVEVEGVEFTHWRELVCYKMCKHIKNIVPNAKVDVFLNGNDSYIQLELSDAEQQKLNGELYAFEKKHNFAIAV